jgi:hypothetical protein
MAYAIKEKIFSDRCAPAKPESRPPSAAEKDSVFA